ncbi:MAG: glycosyltransferase [Calditrichaeota bacterium]|nr:glycosyltransferase [Candidatus Cloacimonadota bacterium]MCB1045647.1 glycosyltransferase [Calditrichota bacterium]MCB9474629.1 glycosyltransferase [Candidatus Delongbacteria bacterium]
MADDPRPLVSVLVPVRDGESHLTACLDSLFRQTLGRIEIVVVDDGSMDETVPLLQAAARRDPRLRVLLQPPEGLVQALNRGLESCRAPLIARMDADDLCAPDRLQLQLEHLNRHPETGLVSCRVAHLGDHTTAGYARHVDWLNSLISEREIRNGRFIDAPLAHPSVMFRRSVLDRHGGWRDGMFPEDHELWLRWLDAGVRMEKLPQCLLCWRDSPERLSRRDPRYSAEAFAVLKLPWLLRELERVRAGRVLISWGAGRESRKRLRGVLLDGWIEIHPGRVGQRILGAPVVHRDSLPAPDRAFVLLNVGRVGAREEIMPRLAAAGYRDGLDCLAIA